MAASTVLTSAAPSAPATLTDRIRAPGAVPVGPPAPPAPFPAMSPAMKVPWPKLSRQLSSPDRS